MCHPLAVDDCTCVLTWLLQGKPRGYAFVEFEEERSVKEAFDRADGRKIDGRRVLVDVERGRTVKGWKPRYAANACATCAYGFLGHLR